MTDLRYWIADVFTDQPLSGNPLAVFPQPPVLSDAQMQAIARELNLSETVFVYPAQQSHHACALRIFTPGTELPFAGHPTVGSALVLAQLERLGANVTRHGETLQFVLEEKVGPIPVVVTLRDGKPHFAQFTSARTPELSPAGANADLAMRLGLPESAIGAEWLGHELKPTVASCGVPFTCIPLRSLEALAQAQLSPGPAELGRAFYLYVPLGNDEFRARMYSADFGIAEDPATGGAAAALTGVLADHDPRRDAQLRWRLIQGVEMGRRSVIDIEADKVDGRVVATRVGGSAVIVGEGQLRLG